jgi:Immunity protein 26
MEKQKRVSYAEGDWFAVPLRTNGFAVGRVARANHKAGVSLGYFFGPKLGSVPTRGQVEFLRPNSAILVRRFSHLGLLTGRWPRISSPKLKRAEWPVPRFLRQDPITGKSYTVTYSDNGITESSLERSSPSDPDLLPKDGVLGDGAVEIVLTKLLDEEFQYP